MHITSFTTGHAAEATTAERRIMFRLMLSKRSPVSAAPAQSAAACGAGETV